MKHLIMGTAGHVDHGKTTLIKALTNIDCDTHPEEKKRGITINLGFAHLNFPSGEELGIIDVPGHHNFIHTMVGGASSMDFVLLLVAADSGIMPQTVEHLNIMNALGVKHGMVVLTKIDLVDQEILEMAKMEVDSLLKNTFLENSPILEVSSTTGEGIDQLRDELLQMFKNIPIKNRNQTFRLFIDRIFTIQGRGNVVTGSVIGGEISTGNHLYLQPGTNKKFRVRTLQRHKKNVNKIVAGDRAAINLTGLERNIVGSGMLLTDREEEATRIIDARLTLFESVGTLSLWSQAIFYLGTYEGQAKIHLITCDSLQDGQDALVQIHLEKPTIIHRNDHFIIRNSSKTLTIGGGKVIDARPLHHRRRTQKLINNINKMAFGKLSELIALEVKKSCTVIKLSTVTENLNIEFSKAKEEISKELSADIIHRKIENIDLLIINKKYNELKRAIKKDLSQYHRRNPLKQTGKKQNELLGHLGLINTPLGQELLSCLLFDMENANEIKKIEQTWANNTHKVIIEKDLQKSMNLIEKTLENFKMQTPLINQLKIIAQKKNIDEKFLKKILDYLISEGKVYRIDENYIHQSIVDNCRQKLLQTLAKIQNGLTVAEFRDLVGGNRKICLCLLSRYDSEGITKRIDDRRVITSSGLKIISS